jgi:SNF2 family DNA or RNA helicase
VFRRKKWRYLILDEAHMIKNWKSQRWQTLLRFNSKRRLLITGTPLQVHWRRRLCVALCV